MRQSGQSSVPDRQLRAPRWLPFLNGYAGIIPGYSLVEIQSVDDSGVYTVTRPTADSIRGIVAITGPAPCPQGGYGTLAFGGPLPVIYAGANPAVGDIRGTADDSFQLTVNKSGFKILGVDTTNKIATVREVAPGATFFEHATILFSTAPDTPWGEYPGAPTHWGQSGSDPFVKQEGIVTFGGLVSDISRIVLLFQDVNCRYDYAPEDAGEDIEATLRMNLILKDIVHEHIDGVDNEWWFPLLTYNLAGYGYDGAAHGDLYDDAGNYDDNGGVGYPVVPLRAEVSGTKATMLLASASDDVRDIPFAASCGWATPKNGVYGVHLWWGGRASGEVHCPSHATSSSTGNADVVDTQSGQPEHRRSFALHRGA